MKKSKKILISFIIIMLLFGICMITSINYANDDYHGDTNAPDKINIDKLRNGAKLTINPYNIVHFKNSDKYIGYCIQKGLSLENPAEYFVGKKLKVSELFDAQDNFILAYFWSHSSKWDGVDNWNDGSASFYDRTSDKSSQWAMWAYISNYSRTENNKFQNILNIPAKGINTSDNNFFNLAYYISLMTTRIESCKIDGNYIKVQFRITKPEEYKNFEKYKNNPEYGNEYYVYINSEKDSNSYNKLDKSDYTQISKQESGNGQTVTYEIRIPKTKFGGVDNYKVRIAAYDYTLVYDWNAAFLTSNKSNQQNLVIGKRTSDLLIWYNAVAEAMTKGEKFDISLQKYIVKVKDKDGNVTTDLNEITHTIKLPSKQYVLRGDFDGNGEIDVSEARTVLRFIEFLNRTNDFEENPEDEFKKIINAKYGVKDDKGEYDNGVEYLKKIGADINKDEKIDYEDVKLFFCDANNDGKLESKDANLLLSIRSGSEKNALYYDKIIKESKFLGLRYNRTLRPLKPEYGYVTGSAQTIPNNPSPSNITSIIESEYKQLDPVKICVGDTVTYKINVYNNSRQKAETIKLMDNATNWDIINPTSIKIYEKDNDGKNIDYTYDSKSSEKNKYYFEGSGTDKRLFIEFNGLDADATKEIYVDFEYISSSCYKDSNSQIERNEVTINKINGKPSGTVNKTNYRTYDGDAVAFEHSVSLEKFVSNVYSPGTKESVNYTAARAGKRYNCEITNDPENCNIYKSDNPVEVEKGDKITYTIRLKNTGLNPVKITKILDSHEEGLKLESVTVRKYCESATYDNEKNEKKSGNDLITHTITFTNPKVLTAGEAFDIDVVCTINTDEEKTDTTRIGGTAYLNRAKIIEIKNENNVIVGDCDGYGNNQDEDYVKPKKYKVSLEKYVTMVTNNRNQEPEKYTDREYKRYNESAGTAANKDGFKKSQTVQLEAGDLVTFTIKIKNEDTTEREKNTDIYVREITDIPISKNKDNSLKYHGCSGVTVSTDDNGKITKITLPNESGSGVATGNGKRIKAQECYTFTMTFEVNVSTKNTQTVQDFSNKAKVTNIYNKNRKPVDDSDGADNNADEDFIKTKVYTVSLEKYIEKVVLSNGEVKDGFNREGLAEHKYNKDLEGYKDDTLPTPGEKHNNVVKADCGSQITYVIKIKNDGDTKVRITGVQDYLPDETTEYKLDSNYSSSKIYEDYRNRIYIVNLNDEERKEKGYYTSDAFNDQTNKNDNSYNRNGIELEPGGTKEFKVTIITKASNLSLDVYKNEAQLNYIENRNKLKVMDTTPKDNKDRDYFKMDSPTKTPIDIRVHKVWENVSENEIPNSITVRLKNKKTGEEVKNAATLNKDNGWRFVWTDLDKDIEYDVTEDPVAGFNKKIVKKSEYEYEITNTKKDTPSPEKTSVYVEKKWSDSENKYGKRPNSVEVALYQDGKQYNNLVTTLSASNSWNDKWENLPKFDNNDGHEYKYTVQELNKPSGYETSIEQISKQGYGIAFKITNTYTGKETEKVSKTVTKIWDDDNNKYGDRPPSINVELYANGNKTGKTATLNSSNSWTYIWNDLDKYSESGNQIIYTVKEIEKINNYIVKYDSNKECDTITNIYNKTHISVYKEWDVEDQSLKKPVKVTLYRNGTALSTAELNEDNSWNHTWDNLDVYDNNQNKYTYTIQETTLLENIESSIYGSGDKYTIINKQIDDEDPIIAGIVWNDVAFDKNSSNYNGKYDKGENKDELLKDIQVYLYRDGVDKPVAETTTDSNGYYRFRNIDLDPNVITDPTERHIKAKVNSTTDNKWNKTSGYYSYTVVFEYDGIKYTSTFDSTGKRIWDIDDNITYNQDYSNAEEGITDREKLNDRFSTIYNGSNIKYGTIKYRTINNSDDHIPQSIYEYDPETMAIKSSTKTIKIAVYKDKELTLQHVNLGLRGRDTLDLELTSDVYSVDVTVNNQTGTYNHANTVEVRRKDIYPDAAHIQQNETGITSRTSVEQKIRATDITNTHYEKTGLGIKVTYKITVLNAGVTNATATKIVNYYDNRYDIRYDTENSPEVYYIDKDGKKQKLSLEETTGGDGYNAIIIATNGKILASSESMNIYVTYELKTPETLLKDLNINDKLPTYNMAEIYEYKSECANGQSEYTRGLIDVDSAPGSANTENARLKGNKTDNNTTAQYYFNANNLKELKFEDDTYTTPVLYFVKDGSERTLTGNVFEDLTTVSDKVRTGDGKQKKGVELNIKGVKVQLVENGVVRFTETTEKDGNYTFKGFLPGNYTVKFTYGNNDETVIINAAGDGMNTKSFNGEDYQATNNTGTYNSNKISSRKNYWYLDNESQGISTATDDPTQRLNVSNYMYNNYPIMETLNYIRDGATKETCGPRGTGTETTNGSEYVKNIKENTFMFANTQNMLISVEKAFLDGDEVKQSNSFGDYEIKNMNFGIAQVPVSTVDLQKHVDEFEIVDSAGINTIAKIKLQDDNTYKRDSGEVLAPGANEPIDVSIENERLQGAKLRITYLITAKITVEKNFDGKEVVKPTLTGLIDFIDNNLEYNKTLGDNEKYWQLISYDDMQKAYNSLERKDDGFTPASTVVKNENTHKVIIEATEYNPLLDLKDGEGSATLVLEKVLSSNDSGIEGVEMNTQNMFGYGNIVEIKGLNYITPNSNKNEPLRDRVRTTDRYIIIPGGSKDTATSEEIVIHPPTGDGGAIGITYYIVGLASLCILAIGVFGIKKFIIKR